jgi:hypothetical protein
MGHTSNNEWAHRKLAALVRRLMLLISLGVRL